MGSSQPQLGRRGSNWDIVKYTAKSNRDDKSKTPARIALRIGDANMDGTSVTGGNTWAAAGLESIQLMLCT